MEKTTCVFSVPPSSSMENMICRLDDCILPGLTAAEIRDLAGLEPMKTLAKPTIGRSSTIVKESNIDGVSSNVITAMKREMSAVKKELALTKQTAEFGVKLHHDSIKKQYPSAFFIWPTIKHSSGLKGLLNRLKEVVVNSLSLIHI